MIALSYRKTLEKYQSSTYKKCYSDENPTADNELQKISQIWQTSLANYKLRIHINRADSYM